MTGLCAAAIRRFRDNGVDMPVYWGNRNWDPMLADTVTQMRDDGVTRALAFVTSAYGGYSSCRQYQEDIAAARAAVGADAPVIEKLRQFWDHPGFVEPHADAVRTAVAQLDPARRSTARLVFTAHSVPSSMAANAGPHGNRYTAQLAETARLVHAAAAPDLPYDLVWQSRSGPPHVPWLEPDINDHLATLAEQGVTGVVVSPIGFVSDHLEVVWDLEPSRWRPPQLVLNSSGRHAVLPTRFRVGCGSWFWSGSIRTASARAPHRRTAFGHRPRSAGFRRRPS